MNKALTLILLCVGLLAFAQAPPPPPPMDGPPELTPEMEELRDTLRFIRMAETKKKLNFSDDKLLKLNEILDDFEAARLANVKAGRELHQILEKSKYYTDDEAEALLDKLVANRRQMAGNVADMYQEIRALLTPGEALQFFVFYEKFQHDVQRRIRKYQRRNNNDDHNRRDSFDDDRRGGPGGGRPGGRGGPGGPGGRRGGPGGRGN